jgi:hypothetical protein
MRVCSWLRAWRTLVGVLFVASVAIFNASCQADDEFSCDAPGCDSVSWNDCGYCPLWSVEAGAIFLRRDSQTDVPLTNGATPVSVSDLAFNDYKAGPLVTLMRHQFLGTAATLELTYFGVQDSNTATAAGATQFFSVPPINFGARTVLMDYDSRLDSTELNVRFDRTSWLTVLAGFRWIELGDDLSTNFGGGATHDVNVNNHLYGAQIGADVAVFRGNRFTIDWFGKAGIYGNSADQSTTTSGVGGAVPSLSASNSQAAFVGEMDLTVRYDFNCHWSLLGGYRALWLDGIALAPDQLQTSNIATGAATLDESSHPIYHGFTLTAQYAW